MFKPTVARIRMIFWNVVFMLFFGCAVSRMNRRMLILVTWFRKTPVWSVLDRRADDFRAINSITLCEQIVSDLASGRKFFAFLHYLTAALFLRKLGASFG